jgi:hypothetical protein
MLRDKYRMAAHGRLFSVIRRISRCQSFSDEVRGVLVNGVGTFIPAVLPLFRPQAKRERNVERASRVNNGSVSTSVHGTPQSLREFLQYRHARQRVTRFIQFRAPDGNRHLMRHNRHHATAHAGFCRQANAPGEFPAF